jgi:outer membrane lipoprotein LolB
LKQGFCLLAACWLLHACTSIPVAGPGTDSQAAYHDRAENIGSVSNWSLVGRISLDDGEEGGSGRLQWVVKADQGALDFHGAMGRGAWHMETGPEGAVLQLADGSEYSAPEVDSLVRQQIGWTIPVTALQWWVRGLSAPGKVDEQSLDASGLLTSLEQFGWQIDYHRYDSDSGITMPTRLDARRDNYRVKLAISRWQIRSRDANGN